MNGLVRDVKRRKSLPLRNCHLLAIGIDSYKNHPTLNNAVGDVEKICECLTEFYGIDTDKVKTLFNKEATKTNILKALRNYFDNKNAQNNLGINDTLVIYFAGHGYKDSALGSGGWIPHESEEDLDEYISASEIIKYLKRIKAQHCFLIMDSCFAAEFLSSDRSNSKANQHKNIDKLIKSDKMPSKWILCSGHDTVKDGNLNDHSPFAKSFLEVLYENTEDYISVYEIIYQTKKKVKRNSFGQEAIGNRLNGQGLGDFYFRKNKQAIIKEIYQKPEDVSIKTARKKWRSFIINFKQKNPYMSRKKTLQFNDRSWDQEDKAWNLPVISIPNFKVLSLQTKNEEISRDQYRVDKKRELIYWLYGDRPKDLWLNYSYQRYNPSKLAILTIATIGIFLIILYGKESKGTDLITGTPPAIDQGNPKKETKFDGHSRLPKAQDETQKSSTDPKNLEDHPYTINPKGLGNSSQSMEQKESETPSYTSKSLGGDLSFGKNIPPVKYNSIGSGFTAKIYCKKQAYDLVKGKLRALGFLHEWAGFGPSEPGKIEYGEMGAEQAEAVLQLFPQYCNRTVLAKNKFKKGEKRINIYFNEIQ